MADILDEDFQDYCSLCKCRQDSIFNLSEQKFLVNTATGCGHKFCSPCIQREFHTKRQFTCPRCRTIVTAGKLSERSLDETQAETDFAVRRKLRSLFNKTEEDFEDMRSFKDYEEMVEDYIHNLVHSIDVESTKASIEAYRKENALQIERKRMENTQRFDQELNTIQRNDERIQASEKEFKDKLLEEWKQKKEKKILRNQIMLGEATSTEGAVRESGSSQQSSNASAVFTGANTVLAFLSTRPLPAPVTDGQSRKRPPIRSSDEIRKLHRAGGYDYSCYEARNWAQIRSELVDA